MKEAVNEGISRRSFLTGAAAAGLVAAAGLAGCAPSSGGADTGGASDAEGGLPSEWDHETDVLIVGAGCAGLCAAVEALKRGVQVTVLDKRTMTGGDAVLCAGIFYASETQHHRDAGITSNVSPEEFWAYLESGGDDEPLNRIRDNSALSPIYYGITKHNPEIIKRNALESASVIDFLDENGVEFADMNPIKPWQLSVKSGEMGKIMTKMATDIVAGGAELMTEVRATKLYVNDEGRVVGLCAEEGGRTVNMKASTVVLATGGFLDNEYLMGRYLNYWSTIEKGFTAKGQGVYLDHTGDGIMMAKEINASLEDMDAGVKLYGGPADGATPPVSWIIFDTQPAYMVNEQGKRLVNENVRRYNGCALALLKSESEAGYTIFDEKVFGNAAANERFGLTAALEGGGLFKADTIAELAAAVGIDAAGLEETVNRINADVEAGVDSEFGKSGETFQKLEPPYYISAPSVPLAYKTEGGIEVNENYQVVEHTAEEVIPGLYAAGATVGSISARLGDCFNSGFIAGACAADEAAGMVGGGAA